MAESNNKWLHFLLVMVVLVLVGMYFHEQIIGSVAYAVEKGVREADKEHLAKVEAISQAFRLVAKQVKPTVVHITTTAKPPERRGRRPQIDPKQIPEPFREFFEEFQDPRLLPQRPREGTGSGVIIDAEAGYIITNNHVVSDVEDGQGRIDVRLPDGRKVKADVVGRDDKTDLALLRINADKLHAITIGDSDAMEVGDWVLAIGSPFGLDQTVTQGIISAKGRSHLLEIPYEDLIQTDAAINPGNSGGPLVNMRGEMIGINTAIATNSLTRGYMGVGFAIPSKTIKEILPSLKEGKEIVRGYLGVRIVSLDAYGPGFGKTFGLDHDDGVLVEDVFEDTPAAKAGLKMDDVILSYDGKPTKEATQLTMMVTKTSPGTKVDLKVWRDGKEIAIPVTIEKQPRDFFTWGGRRTEEGDTEKEDRKSGPAEIAAIGITVEALNEELAKQYGWDEEYDKVKNLLVITEVDPIGEAHAQGMRPGSLIISVQGKEVRTVAALKQALSQEALARGVRLRVRTIAGYRTFFLQVEK
ncbi:MAG TPA: Do family serine endopeptidase [Phycisphaerae bacterium]|nr:Do family serine endopeptidase [Phycisphaerae bacterium]HRR83713.1 Do family serine endopeptidase [Phycisphaerae bacterium]